MLPVIQTDAHTNMTQPQYQGNALIDSQGKAVTTESVNFVAHADKVHSAPAETKAKFYEKSSLHSEQERIKKEKKKQEKQNSTI